MMKIKDNVDLKILKNYPFECSDSGSIFWSSKDCSTYIRIWFHSREISCNDKNNRILKMLKKDDLIEKAEDNENN